MTKLHHFMEFTEIVLSRSHFRTLIRTTSTNFFQLDNRNKDKLLQNASFPSLHYDKIQRELCEEETPSKPLRKRYSEPVGNKVDGLEYLTLALAAKIDKIEVRMFNCLKSQNTNLKLEMTHSLSLIA